MKTIRQLREARGWSQHDLAVKLGVTGGTVYNWERGRTEITAARLRQMARLFEVSMDDIALSEAEAASAGQLEAAA